MNEVHVSQISRELTLQPQQVSATAELLADGGTVPFISRYRKEATGGLDEVAITAIRDRLGQLAELDARRGAILQSLTERNLLTDELQAQIAGAETMARLEDIYLPYRPKRRTRGTIAREKGLEPLAELLFAQAADTDPQAAAEGFVDAEKDVNSVEEALAGARDIIAEWVNEDARAREQMRSLFARRASIKSEVVLTREEDAAKYRDYFDWSEPVTEAPSHRLLAMFRGEREGFLLLKLRPPEEEAQALLHGLFVQADNAAAAQVAEAAADGYRRLLSHSMETELRQELKHRADEESIRVFTANLRQLLLAAPLGQHSVLGLDPGFRTGAKLVCLDASGKLLHNETIYPTQSERMATQAADRVRELVQKFHIEAIAIGNGTASRETESFARGLALPGVQIVVVNESGASVYSASEVARAEFPDHDVTVRGAVSIGRRLQDPLAELVKIDPKSIGVGQYQHDVDQGDLKRGLDDVVLSCVNAVGVELNTASRELLAYVSGLGPKLAENVVKFRDEAGPFASRQDLTKVPRLGPKAFEQAAGFLRVRGGAHPLDASAVHPESYSVVAQMAGDLGVGIEDLMRDEGLRRKIKLERYVTDTVGLPTLTDIMAELAKPGRDPREQFEAFAFAEGVEKLEDLQPGMKLPGIVTNITKFGAFVDVGVHQDGLVHVSELADHFVSDPATAVKVAQQVQVTVLEVDLARQRIALSLRSHPGQARRQPRAEGDRRHPQGKPQQKRQEKPRQPKPEPIPQTALGRAFANLKLNDENR
ncbi:RNA-binding transcriptional accessory protein [bacterium]|nr:RNA-binding transcriptional accessory protein [bacterium]